MQQRKTTAQIMNSMDYPFTIASIATRLSTEHTSYMIYFKHIDDRHLPLTSMQVYSEYILGIALIIKWGL